jgi:uridine phosphorylase
MSRQSIVRPRLYRGQAAPEKVIYLPWDLPSGVLFAELKKLSPPRRYEMFGRVFKIGSKMVLYGATSAPLACLALEPFLLSGTKDIVLLGFCGSLHPGFRVGDAVSISRAIPDEGSSSRYLPGRRRFLPSDSLRASLEADLQSAGLEFKTGTIISTDTPYRETRPWLRRALERGARTVDMETSAVLALAEFHGSRAASLQLVSDELFTGSWRPGFSNPLLVRRARDYFSPFLFSGT